MTGKDEQEIIDARVAAIVIDSEYATAMSNQKFDNADFESLIDMLECVRTEKDYEWMSDIFLPEFPTNILTQASEWVNQYFQSRDFVEVRLDGERDAAHQKATAAKKLLNNILNDKDLFYFHKYLRLRLINALRGQVYIVMWWEQEITQVVAGTKEVTRMKAQPEGSDQPFLPEKIYEPVLKDNIIRDCFNFEVIDPRNVFTDTSYCYSAQQKKYIIVRGETDYESLMEKAERNRYENLDKVKEALKNCADGQTQTAKDTYDKRRPGTQPAAGTPVKSFDILDRYGKFWAVVKDRDASGNPISVRDGIGADGFPVDGAELIEMLITFVIVGNQRIRVRFMPSEYKTSKGKPYRPVVRAWCYIHPTKDEGLSDGKMLREPQIATNDMFNMMMDRAKLATMPTFMVNKNAITDDNQTLFVEPEHFMEVNSPDDIRELVIRDNIPGAMQALNTLGSAANRATATYPPQMGDAGKATQTATAIVDAGNRGNLRSNLKSLTVEYTLLTEFYTMVLEMTNQFARDETIVKLVGRDMAPFFTPEEEYSYTPVSSNIEIEANKRTRLAAIEQAMGRLAAVKNPKIFALLNKLLIMWFELQGEQFSEIEKYLLDEKAPVEMPKGANAGGLNQQGNLPPVPASNQNGLEQSPAEQNARAGAPAP